MGLLWSMPETKGSPASPAENGAMTSCGVQLPDSENFISRIGTMTIPMPQTLLQSYLPPCD